MKKKKLKNLSLNKEKISKIETLQHIQGGTATTCTIPILIDEISELLCSAAFGTCNCEPPASNNCDHTRDCPSWNVAC